MNLTTLQTRLRERIGNPTTDDVPNSSLTNRINEAYEEIWDKYRFHANRGNDTSITTVASTNSYTLPTTIEVVRSVRDTTNGVKLTKMMQREYDSLNQSTTVGKPTRYYVDGVSLYLDPNPDGAYAIKINNRKNYTALSAGSDSPAIPTSWHQGILLLSRYKHWETVGNWQMAQAALVTWREWVKDKTTEIDEELFADASFNFQPEGLEQGTQRLDFDHSDW